jgi:lipid-A-disaccharide synthase
VKKVQRYVDHALCNLPFEVAWFQQHGVQAKYVGHPYFDDLAAQRLDDSFLGLVRPPPGRLVTLLPGSRTQEVRANLPLLLNAAAQVRRQVREVRLVIASYNEPQARIARDLVDVGPVPAEVFVGRTPELIAAADCCLACSGSVSLELLYHAKPAVIVYRVGWLTYQVVRRLVNVRYITLVNLMASDNPFVTDALAQPYAVHAPEHEQVLYPEYPTWRDCSGEIAQHVIGWLNDERSRQRLISRLMQLRDRVAAGGASATAADYIARELGLAQVAPLRKAS